jgi:hypothetical protein
MFLLKCGYARLTLKEISRFKLTLDQIYRFLLKVYPPCFLSAGCVAEWLTVFGKSACCEEECKPLIILDADGAPRASPPETWRVNPWHHLVSPIRFANGGT